MCLEHFLLPPPRAKCASAHKSSITEPASLGLDPYVVCGRACPLRFVP